MRIVLMGDVGPAPHYHVGDEGMLEAAAARLRERIAGVEFTVVSADPLDSAARYGASSVGRLGFAPLRASRADLDDRLERVLAAASGRSAALPATDPAWEVIESVGEADGVLITGGGNLTTPFVEHVYERAALAGIAEIRGIPLVVSGQTLGPRLDDRDRELVRGLLRSARLVGVREAESHRLAEELAGSARLVPDDAVALIAGDPAAVTAALGVRAGGFVAVSFPPYAGLDELEPFIEDLRVLVSRIREITGLPVVVVPHEGLPGSTTSGDGIVAERLGGEGVIVAPVLPAAEVARLTAAAALVVSARYHPLVFALAAGVPAVGVWLDEYTRRKVAGTLTSSGLEGWAVPAAGVGPGLVADVVAETWERRAEIAAHLAAVVPAREATAAAWWTDVAGVWSPAAPRRTAASRRAAAAVTSDAHAVLRLSSGLDGRVAALDRWCRAALAAFDAQRRRGDELDATLDAERRAVVARGPDVAIARPVATDLAEGAVSRLEYEALEQALWERDRFATASARQVIELRHRLNEAAASSDARVAALTRSLSWRLGLPLRVLRRPRHYARQVFRR